MADNTHEEFFQQNPLSFALYNFYERNDYNTLYINDNPDDLRFNLEIKNLSTQAIALSKSTQPELEAPSPNNYHIELKFRPNQLSQRSREKIDLTEVSKEGWSMSRLYENRDHTVSLFLLKRKDEWVIEKQGTKFITLVGLGANSTEGARVTQLEINYKDFYFPQEKSDENANAKRRSIDSQTQIIILTVLNFSGKRAASLTVTFAYAPTLLNNGSDSEPLVLQIVNTGQDSITLNENSRFELTIDAQGDRAEPWALAKKDEAKSCEVDIEQKPENWLQNRDSWTIEGPLESVEEPTWVIRPKFGLNQKQGEGEKNKNFTFKQNEDLFIRISKLRTSLRPGIGNLYIAYYNLPGYMDGKRTLNVSKTCITERKGPSESDGRVGINKYPDSKTQLDVKGKIAANSLNVSGEGEVDSLNVNNIVSARKFEGEGAFVTGMIIMWSGAADALPYGWALCDGTKGTPDLRDRFIVGAGELHGLNTKGEPDQHNHSIDVPSKDVNISPNGDHSHGFPSAWFDVNNAIRESKWGKDFGTIDRGGENIRNSSTQSSGNHSHSGIISSYTLTSHSSESFNRPRWYALCFIIKIRMRVKDVLETGAEDLILKRGDKDGNKDIAWSTETGYSLVFQKDGNLVLYKINNSSQEVIWATGTNGQAEKFTASKDGSFALLNSQDKQIWSTKTSGRNRLVIQEDGNLVVYSKSTESSKKLFETRTQGGSKTTTEAAKSWRE